MGWNDQVQKVHQCFLSSPAGFVPGLNVVLTGCLTISDVSAQQYLTLVTK